MGASLLLTNADSLNREECGRSAAIGNYSNTGIAIDSRGDITAARNGVYARTYGSAEGNYSNSGIAINHWSDINSGLSGIVARTVGSATGAHSNSGFAINNWATSTSLAVLLAAGWLKTLSLWRRACAANARSPNHLCPYPNLRTAM